jgi:hypothetical protein
MTTESALATTHSVEAALIEGDLGKLTPADRIVFYRAVCESLGLNPLTKPFEYLTLNGKLTLYARRDCADQLRRVRGISLEVVSRTVEDGVLTVHVRGTDKEGRRDEDFGSVPVGGLKGEAYSNAVMKCITKAKRRTTLSLAGLGMLDETEVGSVQGATVTRIDDPPAPAAPALLPTGLTDWAVKIGDCSDLDELEAVGAEIREAYAGTKPPRALATVWKARENQIKKGAA